MLRLLGAVEGRKVVCGSLSGLESPSRVAAVRLLQGDHGRAREQRQEMPFSRRLVRSVHVFLQARLLPGPLKYTDLKEKKEHLDAA